MAIVAEYSLVKRNQSVPAEKIYAEVPAAEKGDVLERYKSEWSDAKAVCQNLALGYRTETIKLN